MNVIWHRDVSADAPRFSPSPRVDYHRYRIGAIK
jgi:hypothetical protein